MKNIEILEKLVAEIKELDIEMETELQKLCEYEEDLLYNLER